MRLYREKGRCFQLVPDDVSSDGIEIPIKIELIIVGEHSPINIVWGDIICCPSSFLLCCEKARKIGASNGERVGEVQEIHVAFDVAIAGGV